MGVSIGSYRLASQFLLCPIAGYCDLPYRLIVRPLGGLGLAYTDLVNPRGLKYGTRRSLEIVATCPEDSPLSIQLYGTEADELAEAAAWAAENGSVVVDINMGCPVAKVAGKGGGSGLLRCCPNAVAIAEKVVKACPVPVTVKTRLGWEMGNLVAPALARQLEDVGVAALTIHGRFGEQKFSGSVDRSGIRAVVEAVRSIPVFGNGDVNSPHDALTMMRDTGCAGVMIGRRALADPWIFRDTAALFATGSLPPPPTRLERIDLMVAHFRNMIRLQGEHLAVILFRKRMSWYCRTIGPCPTLRRQMPQLRSVAEFDDLVGEFRREVEEGRAHPQLAASDKASEMAEVA